VESWPCVVGHGRGPLHTNADQPRAALWGPPGGFTRKGSWEGPPVQASRKVHQLGGRRGAGKDLREGSPGGRGRTSGKVHRLSAEGSPAQPEGSPAQPGRFTGSAPSKPGKDLREGSPGSCRKVHRLSREGSPAQPQASPGRTSGKVHRGKDLREVHQGGGEGPPGRFTGSSHEVDLAARSTRTGCERQGRDARRGGTRGNLPITADAARLRRETLLPPVKLVVEHPGLCEGSGLRAPKTLLQNGQNPPPPPPPFFRPLLAFSTRAASSGYVAESCAPNAS
jgi:hypothetical protein